MRSGRVGRQLSGRNRSIAARGTRTTIKLCSSQRIIGRGGCQIGKRNKVVE